MSVTKFILAVVAIMMATLPSPQAANADELQGPQVAGMSQVSVSVSISKADQLSEKGWERVSDELWRKTLDDGTKAQIAFGATAFNRAIGWIDAEIETLRALESLDVEQELKLFELLVRRQRLVDGKARELAQKNSGSARPETCGGQAVFTHTYSWLNSAYPYVTSDTTWRRWWTYSGGPTTYAQAAVCSGGSCTSWSDIDVETGYFVQTSYASASRPTWTCTAHANGYVQLSGNGLPTCETFVCYTTSRDCSDIPY